MGRKERPLYLHSTKYPQLVVDIQHYTAEKGRIRVIGTPLKPEDLSPYEAIPPYKTKPVSPKLLKGAEAEAIKAIENCYYEQFGQGKLDEDAIRAAFEKVKSAVEDGMRLRPGWKAPSTNKSVILYFERNTLRLIMPVLLNIKVFLDSDREEFRENLYKKCLQSSGEREDVARETLEKHLQEAEIVLSHMRDMDSRIPEIELVDSESRFKARREEKTKMLPYAILATFYKSVMDLVNLDPKFAFFAVLVIYGMRPAEAAGCNPSDIIWYDSFCVVALQNQEVEGIRSPKLKNDFSVRPVIISYWGKCVLEKCCELIGDNFPKDNTAMNRSSECSARVKELLLKAGATEEDLSDLSEDIPEEDLDSCLSRKNPELKKADKLQKIACYVLRRCFATIMRSIMGLNQFETDRMLGHKPTSWNGKVAERAGADLNNPETQAEIAKKMERFVFHPNYTLNPEIRPYNVSGYTQIKLIPFPEYCIVNDTESDIVLNLNLEASETGEEITIETPQGVRNLLASSTPKSWKGIARTVIGNSRNKE